MKVSELIEILKSCNPDDVVVMSKDGEGNHYSRLHSAEMYYRFNDGEIGLRELSELDRSHGYSDEDIMEDGVDCVVLWPR